jgi:hypothetical protein
MRFMVEVMMNDSMDSLLWRTSVRPVTGRRRCAHVPCPGCAPIDVRTKEEGSCAHLHGRYKGCLARHGL